MIELSLPKCLTSSPRTFRKYSLPSIPRLPLNQMSNFSISFLKCSSIFFFDFASLSSLRESFADSLREKKSFEVQNKGL